MKYLFLIACFILCSCIVGTEPLDPLDSLGSSSSAYTRSSSSRPHFPPPDFYFDEEKFISEWDIWKSQDIKNYSFTLKKPPYFVFNTAAIIVKNGVMDSFEYIDETQKNGVIPEPPEYTSISDMYQKIYDDIKRWERTIPTWINGCVISIRCEIEYDKKFHYITRYDPTWEMDSDCVGILDIHEVTVSDFTIK